MPKKLVFLDFFRTMYYADHTIPDEVIEAVRTMAGTGKYTLIILSSMATESIAEILAEYGIAEFFTEISGGNKSKSERIKMFMEKYKLKKKDMVFITDTLYDIEEGNKLEVPMIGVTWGLHKRENLQRGNPFKIIDSPLDLLHAVESALG